jgi:hypothetical protein
MSPATAMNAAGAAAHRWGWSVSRTDSAANNDHPNANASRTTPASTFALPGMNGRATSTTARTRPTAIEPAAISPILLFPSAAGVRVDGRCAELSLS